MRSLATRHAIIGASARGGWEIVEGEDWKLRFQRIVRMPITSHMQRLANHQGYEMREEIEVWFSELGGVTRAFLRTPLDQAALDGHFVSVSEYADGKNKKGQVIAWFTMERNYS